MTGRGVGGQSVLVTGGGSGLGRALALRFLEEGASLTILERSEEKAGALESALPRSDRQRVRIVVGDVTSWSDNDRAVRTAVESFGCLDTFIGNAGIYDFSTSLASLEADTVSGAFDELFGVNVKGYLLGAMASRAALRESGGSMVFSVSNAGLYPGGGGPLYTASKHAVVGLIRQLAYELAPQIRVNGVAVGGMRTDLRGPASMGLADRSFGERPVEDLLEALTPLKVRATPEDYTGHYVLLASKDDARTTTGSVHVCDGGMVVRGRQEVEMVRESLAGGPLRPT